MSIFHSEFLKPRPNPKLENHPMSAVQVPTTVEFASSIRNTKIHRRRGLWHHLITSHLAPTVHTTAHKDQQYMRLEDHKHLPYYVATALYMWT
jgi:hypothetical protein